MSKECILLGGGYSIKEGVSLGLWDKIKGKDIWSLNFAYKSLPYPPTREVWVDTCFFNNNSKILPVLHEQGVKLYAKAHTRYSAIPEITQYFATSNKVEYYGKKALEHRILYAGRMKLCGIFALSLAIAEGYDIIYLLGYDFGTPNLNTEKTHFYQDDIQVMSSGVGKPEIYLNPDGSVKNEVEDFSVFTKEGVRIFNVSINSNIPFFTKISYTEFFNLISIGEGIKNV